MSTWTIPEDLNPFNPLIELVFHGIVLGIIVISCMLLVFYLIYLDSKENEKE